jgi:hypothetical protein
MLSPNSPVGGMLTPDQARFIIPSGGNFSVERIEMAVADGSSREIVFNPPYRMAKDEDYAFYIEPDGTPKLWQVEQRADDTWAWLREARRSADLANDQAMRH